MSDKQWREIPLDEICIVRLLCQHRQPENGKPDKLCGAVIEVPLEKLSLVKKCPVCTNTIQRHVPIGQHDPFDLLPALQALRLIADVKISFVIPG